MDDFIAMKRAELGLQPVNTEVKKPRKLSLNEFLRRFTSEDNASFEELHEMDLERFRQKIAWMFRESNQYKALQALAGSDSAVGFPSLVADADGKLRTVPAIKFVANDAQPNIFFREVGEDVAQAKELFEKKLRAIKDKIGPDCQVIKQNTRLPSEFQSKLIEQEAQSEQESMMSVKKNKFNNFNVPLTKAEIQAASLEREKREKFDLGGLLARNRGLVQEPISREDATPVVNGYKMIKDTPVRVGLVNDVFFGSNKRRSEESQGSRYSLPVNPLREELGHKIANEAELRKRD